MDEILQRMLPRRKFSRIGWALVVYYLLMLVAVFFTVMLQSALLLIQGAASGNLDHMDANSMMQNGWGYLLAIAAGLLILRVWKGTKFCRQEIWSRGKPMTAGDFFSQLCMVIFVQLLFQIVASLTEALLNLMGLTAMGPLESATMSVESLSMFLYVCVGAPIAEELLFRGLVLRTLMPYGKRFAIVMSALLFGAYHGNVVQIPYAMAVGLVFGYVAAEHSVAWAMVLHMFNNLVLADMIPRLGHFLPEGLVDELLGLLILGCSIAAMVIAIVRRREIGAYFRKNRMDGRFVKAFFTAPGILVMMILMLVLAFSGLAVL